MSFVTLKTNDLIQIHDFLTEKNGGPGGACNRWILQGLEAMLEKGEWNWGSAAMAYVGYICATRPFPDKNEQVALMAAEVFLRLNGRALTVSEDEALQLVTAVAAGNLQGDDLSSALKGKVEKLSE